MIGYGSNDLARFYSGALVLTVMFSAIFSTISIIEDRREGFLLSMLVSPAPRSSMVLGKILGSATLAWIQGLIFLAFAPLAGVSIRPLELVPVAAAIFLISFTLTGLGFVIAWRMESTSGFHAIMNLLLVPMWMVSGSLFPMSTAHGWVKAIMWVNPLTYSIALLNHTLRLPERRPRRDWRAWWSRLHSAWCCYVASRHNGRAEGHPKRGMRTCLLRQLALAVAFAGRLLQAPSRCRFWARSRRSNSPRRPASPSTANRSTATSGWPTSSTPPAPGRAP